MCTTNDGCEKCTLLPLLYRPACPSDSLRLDNQEQVRGSCVSFDSLGAVRSNSCRLCVSFESLGAVGSSSTRIVCFLREALIRHLRGAGVDFFMLHLHQSYGGGAQRSRPPSDDKSMPLPNPMVGFNLPNRQIGLRSKWREDIAHDLQPS